MQHLEVSGVLRPIYGSLGVKRLKKNLEIPAMRPTVSPLIILKATNTRILTTLLRPRDIETGRLPVSFYHCIPVLWLDAY